MSIAYQLRDVYKGLVLWFYGCTILSVYNGRNSMNPINGREEIDKERAHEIA